MAIEMPKEFQVAGTGTINYQNVLVKVNVPETVKPARSRRRH